MNNDEEANFSEYNILQTIKNIDKQLTYIKSVYNNVARKEKIEENIFDEHKIKNDIEEVVNKIEESTESQCFKNNESDKISTTKSNANDSEYIYKINNLKTPEQTKEELIENESYQFVSKVKDHTTLIISEKEGKVYLPYSVEELKAYLDEYPEEYNSLTDVVNKEYIIPLTRYKNPRSSRFREMHSLMRDVEMKSVFESFKKAFGVMFNASINPAIIAGCKSENQFDNYLYCLEHNRLEDFTDFKIVFEMSPIENKYKYEKKYDFEYMEESKDKKRKRKTLLKIKHMQVKNIN